MTYLESSFQVKQQHKLSYHTILILFESYYNIELFEAHIKQYSHFCNYYQTIVNTFLRVSIDTWRDRKFSMRKFPRKKWEKLAYIHKTDNFAINYSWVYMIHHWWLYGRKLLNIPPSPKKEIKSPQYSSTGAVGGVCTLRWEDIQFHNFTASSLSRLKSKA